jgi:uncharacterized protein YbbK (DUF523 family)
LRTKAQYLVSACLCGIPCRYNGKSSGDKAAQELVRMGKAIPVCPEVLGGLPILRPGVDIIEGEGKDVLSGCARVISRKGDDMTPFLVQGAFASLRIAKKLRLKKALMKQGSPSCGCGRIKRKGKLVKGDGVTAALFKREGIKVVPR